MMAWRKRSTEPGDMSVNLPVKPRSSAKRSIFSSLAATLAPVRQVWPRVSAHSFLLIALSACVYQTAAIAAGPERNSIVARIGDAAITREEYLEALDIASRRKFYHGKTPEGEVAELQREVARNMVDNILLLKEAKRRGLKPDAESIKRALSEYEKRYQASSQWQSQRVALLPKLQKQLETENMLQQLLNKVKDVAPPDSTQLRAYYDANPDKFTEPERVRVSSILIKVAPSAPRPDWDKARADAAGLVKKLRGGTDFAQQARQRSGDESAANGGDMGYLHRGMLAEPAQLVVDKLKLHEISDPVTLLQGVAIFRLDERKTALLNPLPKVEQRARELWRRETGEHSWQTLLVALRKTTPTVSDESIFLPVSGTAGVATVQLKVK
jgi:parvulin-like peptidyl-prolyl isomerase